MHQAQECILNYCIGPCVGNTPAISSINFPGLCLQGMKGVKYSCETMPYIVVQIVLLASAMQIWFLHSHRKRILSTIENLLIVVLRAINVAAT